MGTIELNKKVTELKELEQYAKEIEAEIEAIKDQIKAEMTARNTEEMTSGVFTIRWKEVTQKRFDGKAFKADHEDLYEEYRKETKQKRFTIS